MQDHYQVVIIPKLQMISIFNLICSVENPHQKSESIYRLSLSKQAQVCHSTVLKFTIGQDGKT